MNRRQTLLFVAVLSAVLALAACSGKTDVNPAAPTTVALESQGSTATLGTTSDSGTAVGTAVARPGAVEVKGLIRSVDFEGRTFVLAARNGRVIDVRVTQRTVFAAGPNPRIKVGFRSLRAGMAIDVVGRLERGVLVAASVAILKVQAGS